MCNITPEWISAISALLSMIAAISAAWAACLSVNLQKRAERTRLSQVKNEALLKSIQSTLQIFVEIQATANSPWSDERSMKLRSLSKELKKHINIASSLDKEVKEQIYKWQTEVYNEEDSVSSVVYYILGNLNANTGSKYDAFFEKKTEELIAIQERIFEAIVMK